MNITRYVRDLSPENYLYAFCNDCGRGKMLENLPQDTELMKLREKLVCSKCGGRNVGSVLGYDTGGFPDQYMRGCS